jgi:hypothetical protein
VITLRKPMVWTNVQDALPRDGRIVLVVYMRPIRRTGKAPTDRQKVLFALHSGGAWRFLEPRHKAMVGDRITHWMPKPPVPAAAERLREKLERAECHAIGKKP